MILYRPFLDVLMLCGFGVLTANAQDATKIFDKLEPSVVAISDVEGVGSGVVLTADGLILTNYHVVSSPLPITVEALVAEDGEVIRKTFSNASLFKAHKNTDLALVKVDAEGVKFAPAKLSRDEDDIKTGATCYVIGFPFVPEQEQPVISISQGIINTPNRVVAGNTYIQLDAAINPGNSGGALVSEKGLVIGIPTLRIEGSDSMGMATPVAGLNMDDFVDPRDKSGDHEEASRLANLADQIYLADIMSMRFDDNAMRVAALLQRQAVAAEPNNPEWSHRLAATYRRLQQYDLARAYAESAVKMAPERLLVRLNLGEILSVMGEKAEAAKEKLYCMTLIDQFQKTEQRNDFLSSLTNDLSDAGDHARSVYMISWSNYLMQRDNLSASQRMALGRAYGFIVKPLIDEILRKKDQFSLDDMEQFVEKAGQAGAPERATDVPSDSISAESVSGSSIITRTMEFPSDVDVALKDAPPGVEYDAPSRELAWMPVPFSRSRQARVLFQVTHPDGTEEYVVRLISID